MFRIPTMAAATAGLAACMQGGVEAFNGLRKAVVHGFPGSGKARRAARAARLAAWTDAIGMPHGRSGDKLRRRAASGSVGLAGRRSPLLSWAAGLAGKRARLPRSKRGA